MYQRHLSSDGKLGTGPENKAGSIQQSFLENCYAQDGMQPLVLQATHFAECGFLGKFPGSPPHQSLGNEAIVVCEKPCCAHTDIKLESKENNLIKMKRPLALSYRTMRMNQQLS